MDDVKKTPIVFANQVIRQLVDHSAGSGIRVTADDFLSMRMVFRRYGGSWEQYWHGDPKQQNILKEVVSAWVKTPGRESE